MKEITVKLTIDQWIEEDVKKLIWTYLDETEGWQKKALQELDRITEQMYTQASEQ